MFSQANRSYSPLPLLLEDKSFKQVTQLPNRSRFKKTQKLICLGTVFTITWTPTTTNGTIALALGTGDSADIQVVEPIVSGIPNSGVPRSLFQFDKLN